MSLTELTQKCRKVLHKLLLLTREGRIHWSLSYSAPEELRLQHPCPEEGHPRGSLRLYKAEVNGLTFVLQVDRSRAKFYSEGQEEVWGTFYLRSLSGDVMRLYHEILKYRENWANPILESLLNDLERL